MQKRLTLLELETIFQKTKQWLAKQKCWASHLKTKRLNCALHAKMYAAVVGNNHGFNLADL